MSDLFLLGRIIFGGFFVFQGLHHFVATASLAQYVAAKGVPAPDIAVLVAGVLILVGGLCVLTGYQPLFGLACIALFLFCVTPVMHNFWAESNPAQRQDDLGNFLKNMALFGATLMLSGVPLPWPHSLRVRRRISL